MWHSHVHLYATTAAGDEGRSNDAYNLQGDWKPVLLWD